MATSAELGNFGSYLNVAVLIHLLDMKEIGITRITIPVGRIGNVAPIVDGAAGDFTDDV